MILGRKQKILYIGWSWWCFTRRKIKNIKISFFLLYIYIIHKKALHYKQNILNNQLDIKNLPIIDILINDI